MAKFKKGDKVKITRNGQIVFIAQNSSTCPNIARNYDDAMNENSFDYEPEDELQIADESINNNNGVAVFDPMQKKPIMNTLVTTVRNLFKTEPEKSMVKLGILDESMTLTSEGRLVFIDYLFSKNKEDFNKEVVTPLLAQIKEDNK